MCISYVASKIIFEFCMRFCSFFSKAHTCMMSCQSRAGTAAISVASGKILLLFTTQKIQKLFKTNYNLYILYPQFLPIQTLIFFPFGVDFEVKLSNEASCAAKSSEEFSRQNAGTARPRVSCEQGCCTRTHPHTHTYIFRPVHYLPICAQLSCV